MIMCETPEKQVVNNKLMSECHLPVYQPLFVPVLLLGFLDFLFASFQSTTGNCVNVACHLNSLAIKFKHELTGDRDRAKRVCLTCTPNVGVQVWHLFDSLGTHAVDGCPCLIGYTGKRRGEKVSRRKKIGEEEVSNKSEQERGRGNRSEENVGRG